MSFCAIVVFPLTSCKKDTSGKVTFWYGQAIPIAAALNQTTSFTFYLNNEVIGSSSASVYSISEPDCGSGGAASKTVDLDKNKSQTLSYKVVDEDGTTWWEGTVKIDDGGCVSQQLAL